MESGEHWRLENEKSYLRKISRVYTFYHGHIRLRNRERDLYARREQGLQY